MAPLRNALWNANGVSRHKLELAQFMNDNEIDVMLLAETHLTNKYMFYNTNGSIAAPTGASKIRWRLCKLI